MVVTHAVRLVGRRVVEVTLVIAEPVIAHRQVIVIDEHQQLAARRPHPLVAGARPAQRRIAQQANPRIVGEDPPELGLGRRIAPRALVDHHHLEARMVLPAQAVEQLAQRGQPVVRADDDGDARGQEAAGTIPREPPPR